MTLRDTCLSRVAVREGGVQNSPIDRDGPLSTAYGLTAVLYSGFLDRIATEEDMRAVTPAIAREVFEWECDRFHLTDSVLREFPPLAEHVYDAAVHHGGRRTVRFLQSALGLVGVQLSVDGVMGPRTQAAIAGLSPAQLEALSLAFFATRLISIGHLITSSPQQAGNAWGWCRRLAGVLLKAEGIRP